MFKIITLQNDEKREDHCFVSSRSASTSLNTLSKIPLKSWQKLSCKSKHSWVYEMSVNFGNMHSCLSKRITGYTNLDYDEVKQEFQHESECWRFNWKKILAVRATCKKKKVMGNEIAKAISWVKSRERFKILVVNNRAWGS